MPSKHKVSIKADGTIRFVYDDELEALKYAGPSSTRRASFVEPDRNGLWVADLSPIDGPVFGPFRLRKTALDAERDWIEEHAL
jgi:hypothetical protein